MGTVGYLGLDMGYGHGGLDPDAKNGFYFGFLFLFESCWM
jgi:hypothetical protein